MHRDDDGNDMSASKAIGAARNYRRNRGLTGLLVLSMLAAVIVLLPSRAGGALPTPALFELDGNALTGNASAGTPDDWDRVYCGLNPSAAACTPSPGPSHAATANFVSAPPDVFGGGSKTDAAISSWSCAGGSPSKNDIADLFSAAYTASNGDTIVFFGADRDDTSGNSNVGFWFMRDPTFGAQCGSNPDFTGTHEVGDVFVSVDYTNGGSQPQIDVYTWNGTGITEKVTGAGVCTSDGVGQDECAIGNTSATVSAPWQSTVFAKNGFVEGGIDLNTLFASGDLRCYSSFLGVTRASSSGSAELKNFGVGSLNTCGSIELKKTWIGPPGSTALNIGTTTGGHDIATKTVTSDDTTGPEEVDPGTYYVSESLASTSTPGQYSTALACANTKGGGSTPVTIGTGNSVQVTTADQIVCTYTNTFNKLKPTVSTQLHDATGGANVANGATLPLGASLYDSATITGAGAFPLTGSLTYELFSSTDCSGTPVHTDTGVATDGSSTATGPLGAGNYSFHAEYAAGSDAAHNDSDFSTCEPFSVSASMPTLSTTVKDGSGSTVTNASPAGLGAAVHDTAVLGGSVGSFPLGNGTGSGADSATVTYEVFSSNDCSGGHTDQVVNVGAGGSVPDADPQTPAAGSHSYLAVYNGNHDYASRTAECEPFMVGKETPTVTTTLHDAAGGAALTGAVPAIPLASGVYDTATVTAVGGFSLAGTVTFRLFGNGTCNGDPVATEAGVEPNGSTATSSQQHSLGAGSYSFDAQYVAGNDPSYTSSPVSSCEPFTVNAPTPASTPGTPSTPSISIVKKPKSQTITPGSTANFTITVTNTGNVTLTDVNVSDALSPACNQTGATIPALASLAPYASVTYNCALANVTASFTNSATATGTPPSGPDVTKTDAAQVVVTVPFVPPPPVPTHPSISIAKDPKTQSIGVGGTATFTITVTNNGDVTLTDVRVVDPHSTDCNKSVGQLVAGKSVAYTCTRADVPKDFVNVAVASGKPPTGPRVTARDRANVTAAPFTPPQRPGIKIVKSPKHQTLTTRIAMSQVGTAARTKVTYADAHFKIRVTNTGNVTLRAVKVVDPNSPACNRELGTLAPRASRTYRCIRPIVSSDFKNVATASGKPPKGKRVKSTDHANVKTTTTTTTTSAPATFTG
jgi:uncharacterized repeat protein (TIGR01451 family)